MRHESEVRFSVISHAVWTPTSKETSALQTMPPLLRRRASNAGKMALEVAFKCLESTSSKNIPTLFCSRHGECERSVQILSDLVQQMPISPTTFSLSVHNATNGLFSMARSSHENSIALASGQSTIENGVIEACSLLEDNFPLVLLVAFDTDLPAIYKDFQEPQEHTFAFAWLLQASEQPEVSLSWTFSSQSNSTNNPTNNEIFDFILHKKSYLEKICDNKHWQWKHLHG